MEWSNETTYAGFRQMVHDLIALRKNSAGTTAGLLGENCQLIQAANKHGSSVSPAIAYHRWDQQAVRATTPWWQRTSATPSSRWRSGFPQPGTWHVRFNSDDTAYSPDFGGTPSPDVTAQAPRAERISAIGDSRARTV